MHLTSLLDCFSNSLAWKMHAFLNFFLDLIWKHTRKKVWNWLLQINMTYVNHVTEKTQKLFFFNHVDSTLNFHNSDQLLSVSRSNFFLLSMAFRLLKKLLPELLFKYWENCLFQPLGNALPSYSQLFSFWEKKREKPRASESFTRIPSTGKQ